MKLAQEQYCIIKITTLRRKIPKAFYKVQIRMKYTEP